MSSAGCRGSVAPAEFAGPMTAPERSYQCARQLCMVKRVRVGRLRSGRSVIELLCGTVVSAIAAESRLTTMNVSEGPRRRPRTLITASGVRRRLSERCVGYETGIVFFGSTNGIGTTVAVRVPHSDSTSSTVPVSDSSTGTQA